MTWHTGRLALFDLETTGVDPHRDRVVTAAIIEAGGGTDTRVSSWLVNPGIPIPDGAAAIHGITNEEAAGGADPTQAIYEIAEHLTRLSEVGAPVVGHNVTYDLTMLHAECLRHGFDDLASKVAGLAPVVDTFVLDKWADTYRRGSRKLVDVAAHYGVALSEAEAHGATADALAAGRVAWRIAQKYPGTQIPLVELHQLQVEAKRAQAESFGAYLVRQGKTDDVAREWPIQPAPPGWGPDQLPVVREDVPA